MQTTSFSRKFAGAAAALALCTSSTGAIAASKPVPAQSTISPLVALSALGSDASRAALCGAVAAAAAGAAAAAQGAPQGCVLPVVDTPPPPTVADALPPPPVAPPPVAPLGGGGFGISPLLLALAGVTAAVLAFVLLRKDKDEESPD